MTCIKEFKDSQLSEIELSKIQGGAWSHWEIIDTDPQSGITIQQRFNWWGAHGTSDIQQDCNPMI